MTSEAVRFGGWLIASAAVLFTQGCGGTLGRAQLTDGNQLVVKGSGAKAALSVKCLSADEIKALTGSNIDPNVPQQSCYTVVFVSGSSSSISRAVTSYLRSDSELQDMVTQSSVATPVAVSGGPVGDVVKSVVSDAVAKPANVVATSAANTTATLDAQSKAAVKAQLTTIAAKLRDPNTKEKVDAAIQAIH